MNMLLERKNAVVYGGGGKIGGAVAQAFAREGATVHLAGRTLASLERVAAGIRGAGGTAETARVDALDETAVREHADAMVQGHGSLDISVNLISHPDRLGTPLTDMRYEDFERSITRRLRTMWITTSAAAPHMTRQGSGVILTYGGYGHPLANYGGFQVSFGAIEAMRRTLACELGRQGVRVLTIQTGGVPEGIANDEVRETITTKIADLTMTGRPATLADVGNVAVFAASEWARTLTATKLNITGGTVVD
jgi:3-oxoacyl-[acyl-carrier protein] reductase